MSNLFVETLPVVDRSTLERYAECPAQARHIESGATRNAGYAAAVGNEVHNAISRTIREYIDSQGAVRPADIRETLTSHLRASRPDVQPDVLRAFNASLWGFAEHLGNIHFSNVLKYDGGEGDQSGQLSHDFPGLGVRITSEVDLLHTATSWTEGDKTKSVLDEADWKSGWKGWTEDTVRDSFQFQMHAFLVFENYPDVEALRVRVLKTRFGKWTYPVEFTRNDLPKITARMYAAAGEYLRWHELPAELCDTWPTIEKCGICPVASICPAADRDASEIAKDPAAFVAQLVAVDAKADAMRKTANAWVDQHGEIITPAGFAYGIGKPASRKPTKALYKLGGKRNGDDGESED